MQVEFLGPRLREKQIIALGHKGNLNSKAQIATKRDWKSPGANPSYTIMLQLNMSPLCIMVESSENLCVYTLLQNIISLFSSSLIEGWKVLENKAVHWMLHCSGTSSTPKKLPRCPIMCVI